MRLPLAYRDSHADYLLSTLVFCISEMTNKLKKDHAFWAAVCLLLSVVPELLNALPEEDDDTINTDSELRPMKPLHTFCAMKAEDGPCKAMIRSYYFNMNSHQCEEFIYREREREKERERERERKREVK